jgi:hypothetical protein
MIMGQDSRVLALFVKFLYPRINIDYIAGVAQ